MQRGKLAADHTDETAGREPEEQQESPGEPAIQREKETAEVHPQRVLENQQTEPAQGNLPNGIAQDRAWMADVQLLVDLEP